MFSFFFIRSSSLAKFTSFKLQEIKQLGILAYNLASFLCETAVSPISVHLYLFMFALPIKHHTCSFGYGWAAFVS